MISEKKKVGPLDYSPERKYKIPGVYEYRTVKGQMLNEVEYCSAQSPGPDKYSPKSPDDAV